MNQTKLCGLLREGGYKITDPRAEVLALLDRREGTFTAAELHEALIEQASDVGRATLFRTLDLLIELGALERVRLPGAQEGYVLCGPPHHHHIVCSSCGAIGEVEDRALETALAAAVERSGFTLQAHALELTGVCAGCGKDTE